LYYTFVVSQKQATKFLSWLHQFINDFQHSFIGTLSRQFATSDR